MDLDKYLQEELENCGKYEATAQDKKLIEEAGMLEFIFSKVSSKKFRKWKLEEATIQQIKKAIDINITANQAIKFSFPFGGYKLWSMPSAPEVDWAEFFMISYYCKYLAPIAAMYKPGVHFRFSSDDVVVAQMDNIPKEDTERYNKSFNALLDNFRKYLPNNLKIELLRVGDMYPDKKEYQEELAIKIQEQIKQHAQLDDDKKAKAHIMSKLNIQWKGIEDWTKLSDKEQEDKIELGTILHSAYCDLSKRRSFIRSEDNITIFATPIRQSVALGTTKSSAAKFWAGFGVLQKKNDSYSDKILSPSQLKEADNKKYKTVKNNLIPLDNFKEIRVYEELLNFSN